MRRCLCSGSCDLAIRDAFTTYLGIASELFVWSVGPRSERRTRGQSSRTPPHCPLSVGWFLGCHNFASASEILFPCHRRGTHVTKTTSHFPSFSPASSSRSKSMTFCSSFSFPAALASFSCSVTCRPYSETLENVGDASNSWRRTLPVAPVAPSMSAERPARVDPAGQSALARIPRLSFTHLPFLSAAVIFVWGRHSFAPKLQGKCIYCLSVASTPSGTLSKLDNRRIICSSSATPTPRHWPLCHPPATHFGEGRRRHFTLRNGCVNVIN